jgi:hypothetical protein
MANEYLANVISIRNQINIKKGYKPYFSTSNDAESVVTDFDHFPYTRFYRGVYNKSYPIVLERESGWKLINNSCYKGVEYTENVCTLNLCFQNACSTVLPCYKKK